MKHLDYCLQKAREIPYVRHQQRHYAIVVDKRGRVVAEGSNSYTKSSPLMQRLGRMVGVSEYKCFLHAEIKTILRDKTDKGVKLCVARVNAKGEAVNSKPCEVCEYYIKTKKNIKSIEYTL